MRRVYKVYFTCNDKLFAVDRKTFDNVDTGNVHKDILVRYSGDDDLGNRPQEEEYWAYYDDEQEDYKDSYSDCIDAFCKVHNIPRDCPDFGQEGYKTDELLKRIGPNDEFNSIEKLAEQYTPFFGAYDFLHIISHNCYDEYDD